MKVRASIRQRAVHQPADSYVCDPRPHGAACWRRFGSRRGNSAAGAGGSGKTSGPQDGVHDEHFRTDPPTLEKAKVLTKVGRKAEPVANSHGSDGRAKEQRRWGRFTGGC
eukprot:scaffold7673_cov258-Pinguiococcus_pyrenoidosus.AAC.9